MSKKNLTIILSIVVIAAFFLPFIKVGPYSFSAFDYALGRVEGLELGSKFLFISFLIPIGAILLLWGAFANDPFTKSGFVLWMPLIGTLYLIVMLYVRGSSDLTVSELISWLGYGFWILLGASIILLFTRR